MLEIEIKAPCKDLTALEARLRSMGARDFGMLVQKDVYYSHPQRDFGQTDEALRLRQENDIILLVYKGPKIDATSKSREELEVTVSSFENVDLILRRLGFQPFITIAKTRRVYGMRGISICLDRVEGLGDFVEFEYEGDDLEKGKERIAALMRELGIEGNERRSYLELLMQRK
ncbi:MAG: class IV adenylate cyclase [Methanomassiliicoccales archaeon]